MTVAPHEIIEEEREPLYLASAFPPAEAAEESGYRLDEVDIREEHYRPRPLTAEEIADEVVQLGLDSDRDPDDPPATVEYLPCSPDHRDAACYLRVVPLAEREVGR